MVSTFLLAGRLAGQPATTQADEEAIAEATRESLRQHVALMTKPLILYGKVVDQSGNGVEGAEVVMHVDTWDAGEGLVGLSIREVRLRTSAEGMFRMDGSMSGTGFSVHDVELEGYEFRKRDSWRGANYVTSYKPDPARPEILRVRKRQPGTFLNPLSGSVRIESGDQVFGINLFGSGGVGKVVPPPKRLPDNHYTDVKFSAVHVPERSEYLVTCEAGGASDGVQYSMEELYTAPDDGYRQKVSFAVKEVESDSPPRYYLYTKSRKPSLYSRITLIFSARPDRLRIDFTGVANPYGEKNLELDPGLLEVREVYYGLRKESEKAFTKGRRPEKPDLARLLREGRIAQEASDRELRAGMIPVTQPTR